MSTPPLPTTLSSSYTWCANGSNAASTGPNACGFTGTQSIGYAAIDGSGLVYYRNLSNSTPCSNDIFVQPSGVPVPPNPGDPSYGHLKACYNAAIPPDILAGGTFYDSTGNPSGWKQCAVSGQNSICNPTPNQNIPLDILYGANGHYVYANAIQTACNEYVFGDPAPGLTKSCWWRSAANTPPPYTPTPSGPGGLPPVTPPPTPAPSWWSQHSKAIIIWSVVAVMALIVIIILIVILRGGTKTIVKSQ